MYKHWLQLACCVNVIIVYMWDVNRCTPVVITTHTCTHKHTVHGCKSSALTFKSIAATNHKSTKIAIKVNK